jgi:hypothetical protein
MLHHCHRYRKGDICRSHCESRHGGHGARAFPTRHVKHWGHVARTVRPCFYLSSGDNDPSVVVPSSVVIWLLAIWIGGFFRGVNIATPKDNNLLVYTLILLVRVTLFFVRRSFTTDRLQIIGVPVGLPCVTTTTMAVGAAFLARRKAIVQKLTAIESLAGVDVLCTDKTGTLTANQLSVHERTC